MSTMKGIDVSYYQGNVNWSHVKTDGVKFAIIRAGYGSELSQKDKQFENNYAGCKSNGVACGVYWFSYAESVEEAKQEAQVCLQVIKGKTFEYPIYFDMENPCDSNGNVIRRLEKLGKKACSDIVQAFCDEIEKAGYFAGLYCSTYYLENYISESVRKRYAVWVAEYSDVCNYTGQYGMWQNSSKGRVYGIDTDVDMNECYIDYPTTIKNAGLNGFKSSSSTTSSKQDIVTYSFNDGVQITEHFNSREFNCKCGKSHDTLISTKLVTMLETLFSTLHCSKIIINSGYRCQTHDVTVGGTGSGQHTLGNAADVMCYAEDGSVISSKVVSCVAQDLGFTGIANIDSSYRSTHLDVRTGSVWYGNEVVNNSTVTKDFYDYYGLTSADIEVYTKVTPPEDTNTGNSDSNKDTYTLLKNGNPYMEIKEL